MIYGITGPTEITDVDIDYIIGVLDKILKSPALDENGNGDSLISGAAHGVDSIGAIYAYLMSVPVTLTVPIGKWHDEDLVQLLAAGGQTIIEVTGGYMIRNDKTIELSEVLLAFPETNKEELRSGTWATIRRARKREMPVYTYPLDQTKDYIL